MLYYGAYSLVIFFLVLLSTVLGCHMVGTSQSLVDTAHIVFSILTFLVLLVSAMIALGLAFTDYLVRRSQLKYLQYVPSIESLERFLIDAIRVSFVCLSILLSASFYYYHVSIFSNVVILHKTMMSILTWFLLLWLLIARWLWGMRCMQVVYLTLISVILFIVVYFFSQWLIPVIG